MAKMLTSLTIQMTQALSEGIRALCKNRAEFHQAHAKLGKVFTAPKATKSFLNVPIFKLPIKEAALHKTIETAPGNQMKLLKSVSSEENKDAFYSFKKTKQVPEKNMKRTLDAKGYQVLRKYLTINQGKVPPSTTLSPTIIQTNNNFQPIGDDVNENTCEDEKVGDSVLPPLAAHKHKIKMDRLLCVIIRGFPAKKHPDFKNDKQWRYLDKERKFLKKEIKRITGELTSFYPCLIKMCLNNINSKLNKIEKKKQLRLETAPILNPPKNASFKNSDLKGFKSPIKTAKEAKFNPVLSQIIFQMKISFAPLSYDDPNITEKDHLPSPKI
ncbi:hypothetical protein NPIL_144001 [Nephila pilipes]|uniref:Uncharacterized protein n=1 Tax=Nephila pilipes TaxID=299642 RepID=A0A8X6MPI5_NEPPI|nr:hypothetical protein NPIL_144001 [Nephila pilipes]